MSLTTRLLLFFLAALGLVLVGFSATLYLLAQDYLDRQVEARLSATLDTLEADIDREPDGLEWDPRERLVPLGRDQSAEAVRWEVRGAAGKREAHSANLGSDELIEELPTADAGTQVIARHRQPWRIAWRRLRADTLAPTSPGSRRHHAVLVLVAGASLDPRGASLDRLAVTMAVISLGVWLAAAVAGRGMCRRALAPVTRMATAARAMDAADLAQRLPDPHTAGELAELHAAFNGWLDRLQEAFERQRRFTGDASHQLRTPLTAMLGQVEVALRRERPIAEYRRVLGLVQSQADHLRRIVEAMLFLARADAESSPWRLEPVNLAQWLPQHLKNWADHPRAADLHVDFDGTIEVQAQPLLLGQLLDNLLDNAFKYSTTGQPVTVRAAREADAVTLTVEDAGCGIQADDLPHVFDAFYRSSEARQRGLPGVGLGLATAKRIAAALGGTLVATSGQGSRFTLRLPAGSGTIS
jgi:heavy metal sensor kinase